jgi:hypothetical protein
MATKIWLGNASGDTGDWGNAANWSPSGVPANGDDVYLQDTNQSVITGLNQSSVVLNSLNISQSFTGQVGTASAYLQISASIVNIGYNYRAGTPQGSNMLKIDLGTTAATIVVFNTGVSADSTRPTLRLKCNNANTTLEVRKGTVGIAVETGETATLNSIAISYINNIANDADVYIGTGVTLTTLTMTGGYCLLCCAATTVYVYAGSLETEGSGAITTLSIGGGTCISNSTGTITNCNIKGSGQVDFTKSIQPRTITHLTIDDTAKVKLNPAVLTLTNNIISTKAVALTASLP